ncbi:MAG: uncharacterized membrane-anchored protein YhcB (DUF1043 family) [Bermanella sp.]|jgi:uncharacterized membrane-anchored protein YhcB (DUF1043 family)
MNRWLSVLICLVMVTVVGLQLYQLRSNQAFQRDVAQELAVLRAELNGTRKDNERLESELAELRSNDISTMVEGAGDALVTGWSSMLDALETELRKAEKSMRERSAKSDSSAPDTE